MSDLDDAIDRLYQGPLDAFTGDRNALAKATRQADLKTLAKPSLPAWAVNQLYWHRRPVIERLETAAGVVRAQHHRALSGAAADVRTAEQAHRDVVREALAEAREVLVGGGHPVTPATLDAVRETLQALPSPEAAGRLVRPLGPQGFEALAGLTMAPPRTPLRVVPRGAQAEPAIEDDAAEGQAEAERARAKKAAEREAREQRKAADQAVESARAVLQRAEIALDDAERVLKKRRAERDAAATAHEQATAARKQLG